MGGWGWWGMVGEGGRGGSKTIQPMTLNCYLNKNQYLYVQVLANKLVKLAKQMSQALVGMSLCDHYLAKPRANDHTV